MHPVHKPALLMQTGIGPTLGITRCHSRVISEVSLTNSFKCMAAVHASRFPVGKSANEASNSCNPTGRTMVTDEYQAASSIAADINALQNTGSIIDRVEQTSLRAASSRKAITATIPPWQRKLFAWRRVRDKPFGHYAPLEPIKTFSNDKSSVYKPVLETTSTILKEKAYRAVPHDFYSRSTRLWRRPVRGTFTSAYCVLRAATKRLVEEIQALQNLEARTHCIRRRKEE
uniref:Uncharacterized protein n=1 Tax=Vespula pensylvanica TaxID=30213 RepID=A0A834UFA5_VESPE|nr:hypothetical protein H0235_003603 [Vespula pensylvanica]